MPATVWHEGERIVQDRLAATEAADRVAKIIKPGMPDAAKAFLFDRDWVVLTTADPDGSLWTSVARGPAGFLVADADDLLVFTTELIDGDPMAQWLVPGADVGGLAIDLGTRRRMRFNGKIEHAGDRLAIRTEQVLSNCPKFIQKRSPGSAAPSADPTQTPRSSTLSADQIEFIRAADTFFIGTADEQGRADASHRGGHPGFLEVTESTIAWDELPGNSMYMTLGNLEQNPSAALLVVDFDSGTTLHLTGTARVSYEAERPRVEYAIAGVIEQTASMPTGFGPPEFSPHLPA